LQELDIEAPASVPAPAIVVVRNNGYVVSGKEVARHEDVIALLKERGLKGITISVSLESGQNYEQIGKLIFAAHRAGIAVGVDEGSQK
jgi:hypothetical protein